MRFTTKKGSYRIFRLWRLLFFIIVLVLFAVGGLFWYWKKHKKAIVKDNLEQIVSRNSKGLYKLTVGKLNFDEATGWVRLNNIDLDYDSLRYSLLKSNDEDQPMLLRMKVGRIDISGITSGAEMRDGIFRGKRMEILNPEIEIVYTDMKQTKNIPSKEEIYKEITAGMDLELDSIIIVDAIIRTRKFGRETPYVQANNISISLTDVKVNDQGLKDSSRLFFSKAFSISGKDISWSSPNNIYNYQVSNISISSNRREIKAGEFSVKPLLGEQAYTRASAVRTDRMDFYFRNFRITDVDMKLLLDEKLSGDELLIGSAGLKIYRDNSRPPGKSGPKEFPQEAMAHTPFKFRLRRMVLENGNIEYKEKSSLTYKTGKVSFSGLRAVVSNFTNDPFAVGNNNKMRVEASAMFLGMLPLNTEWTFYLLDPSSRFALKGAVGSLEGSKLNGILEPMGPARIDQGTINSVDFNFNGSENGIKGTVKFLYQDLKITLLEVEKGAIIQDRKSFTSFLANILIKNDNPKRKQEPRIAMVDYPRVNNVSLFNLCWRGLLKGLKESVGIKKQ